MSPVPETESSEFPSKELEEKFKAILKANGITDEVLKVSMKDAGLKGEGFASITNLVTIHFQNPTVKPLNLFVKSVTTNPSHQKFLQDTKLFEKEAAFFTDYVPEVEKFCRDKGFENLLDIYPKCYFADTKLAVFENLVIDKGFELLDKAEQQDITAAKLALTSLAKHHAISFAYKTKIGGTSALLEKFPIFSYEPLLDSNAIREMMAPAIEDGIQTNLEVLNKCNTPEKEFAETVLNEKAGRVWDFVIKVVRFNPDDPIHVLNHGDYWNNNMMFHRNKETNILDGHKAIDLQGVRCDSPGADLGYFLYSSVKPEVRRKHLNELLTHYLEVLNDTTEKLESPANLSFEQLYGAFLRKFHFGFWFCALMSPTRGSYEVMKDIDITTIDMSDFSRVIKDLLSKWMDANPDLLHEDAKAIVELTKEYDALAKQCTDEN